MKKTKPSLLLALVASAVLLPVVASKQLIGPPAIQIRALPEVDTSASSSSESTTPAPATTTEGSTTTAAATTATPTTNAATSAAPSPTAGSSSAAANPTTTHGNASSPSSTQGSLPVVTSEVATTATNSAGQVVTSLVEVTTSALSATPSQTSSSDGSNNGGLGTGSIIGLSVAGGIAAIGIISFFVWKFTRKRFTDFDDNEAIKWPELNAHGTDVHALPTNDTGRAGFGPENDSDINLTRAPSPGGTYANSIGASSVPEMYGSGDPYAVPPLPHLNPNQPYRDDPGTYGQSGAFYDPYRGPVPNTFADNASDNHTTEAIPMTQMARVRSPAPQAAYDVQGRASPAPQAATGYAGTEGRSGTPTPGALGGGRASPSQYAYGPR